MKIPVFYTPKMVTNIGSFSPSAGKPAVVVNAWQLLGLPIEIIEPDPVTVDEIKLAHDPEHVEKIMAGEKANGFGNNSHEVAMSLLYANGAMLSAARKAINNRKVAVAPCSGFHHAGYASATAFCTFNGLMVTALVLKSEGLLSRVGILDFDMHYGNGTDNLIKHHHAENWVEHYTAGREYLSAMQANDFMARIPEFVAEMRDCDVILYQAGADPHIDDPLGGFLTTQQLRERDRIVFETANELKVPIAWNLAGGYQVDSSGAIPVISEIHNNTLLECVAVYV